MSTSSRVDPMEQIKNTSSSNIEIDSFHENDEDSTKSVTSSVRCFQKENGRTYHGYRAGTYHFPNDPTETERLDFQYYVIQHALNDALHFAHVPSNGTILDVGTGTGTWAIQMGDKYPNADIEATDLSPVQPTAVPPNVQFIVDDAEQCDWAVPYNHYDYIHTRILMGCFQDFGGIIQRGFEHLKPGGWMESQDITMIPSCDDGSMPKDWPLLTWSQDIEEAANDAGRPLNVATRLKQWYIDAGFVEVEERVIKLPINTWPKNPEIKALGKWWAENLLLGLQGFSLALLSRINGWNKTEIEVYLSPVRKSIKDRRVHAYHKFYIVTGRKPLVSPKPKPLLYEAETAASATPSIKSTSSTRSQPDPIATQWYHSHVSRLNPSSKW